jgi:RimJ/RimL family protein N-acetyltransferase
MDGQSGEPGTRLTDCQTAPYITTDRLILRGFERRDFDVFCEIRAKPEVMQYISATPFTRTQLWEKFLRSPATWSLLGYGNWAIEQRSDKRLIGEVGFADYMREMQPPLPGPKLSGARNVNGPKTWPEASWLLDSDAHGEGYASEALEAALAWADRELKMPLTCIISPENAPSLRLAARHGFLVMGHHIHQESPVLLMQRGVDIML